MSGHDGVAPSHETVAVPDTAGPEQSMVADYTESVVPASARRSSFRMLLTFGSMQLVFGAAVVYLVGVAVVARGAKAKALLGYSRIEEVDAASTAAVSGVGGHGGS